MIWDRVFQSWLRQTTPRLKEWLQAPNDDGTLLRGGALSIAEDWLNRRRDDLNSDELNFVEASFSLRTEEARKQAEERQADLDRERERAQSAQKLASLQQGRARVAVAGTVAAIGLALLAGYFSYEALESSDKARRSQRSAESSAIARIAN